MPLVTSSGLASGINSYAVVVIMGVLGRFLDVEAVPDSLRRTDVLLIAGGLYLVEFVTDKIPYVDSMWDTISTVVRPTIGAMLGYLLAGDAESVHQALYAALGGGTALASHLVKAGGRLAINTSPEPFTNVAVSSAEDVSVLGVVTLAFYHPWIALGVASFLFLVGATLVVIMFRYVLRGFNTWKARGTPANA